MVNDEAQTSEAGTEEQSASTEQQEAKVEVKHDAAYLTERLVEVAAEAKRYRKEVEKYRNAARDAESAKLAEQGKWKDLYEQERQNRSELEQSLTETKSRYAYTSVINQIKDEAAQMGCVDFEVLEKILPVSDLEVDENYNVNKDQVKAMLEMQQKKRSWLFQKGAPKIFDGKPVTGPTTKSTGDLSLEETQSALRQALAKQ